MKGPASRRSALTFSKLEGCGNGFVVADLEAVYVASAGDPARAARVLCHPGSGAGADGLMLVGVRDHAGRVAVDMVNPDGSAMGNCGNGIRCVMRYVCDRDGTAEASVTFAVAGRDVTCSTRDGGRTVTARLGSPDFTPGAVPVEAAGPVLDAELPLASGPRVATVLSLGNPHCVLFADGPAARWAPEEIRRLGPLVERDPLFPRRVNVGFVGVTGPGILRADVWERSAGLTLACGTGAAAALVAAAATGRCGRRATVALPGGTVTVSWDEDDQVSLTGPTSRVYDAVVSPECEERLADGADD